MFELTIVGYFLQNRMWLEVKHFSSPNNSVHKEL